jgi:citrate/tricarballylate utilization protein
VIAAVSVAAFILGFAVWQDRQILFGVHSGPGAFYKLMPHNAMAALFGAAFLYAVIALVMGVRAFWRDIGEPVGMKADAGSIWQAIRDAGSLRYLDGGGVGCFTRTDRPTDRESCFTISRSTASCCASRHMRGDAVPLSSSRAKRLMPGGMRQSCSARSAASGC